MNVIGSTSYETRTMTRFLSALLRTYPYLEMSSGSCLGASLTGSGSYLHFAVGYLAVLKNWRGTAQQWTRLHFLLAIPYFVINKSIIRATSTGFGWMLCRWPRAEKKTSLSSSPQDVFFRPEMDRVVLDLLSGGATRT